MNLRLHQIHVRFRIGLAVQRRFALQADFDRRRDLLFVELMDHSREAIERHDGAATRLPHSRCAHAEPAIAAVDVFNIVRRCIVLSFTSPRRKQWIPVFV